jgi:hypothetical protein
MGGASSGLGVDRDVRGVIDAIRRRGHDQILAVRASFATDEVVRRQGDEKRETGSG